MASKIIIEAEQVWDYFNTNFIKLKNAMHKIAEYEEYGIEIYITEASSLPRFVVEADSITLYEESVVNEVDCEITAKEIYDEYLTEKAIEKMLDDGSGISDEEEFQNMEIEERENELFAAVFDCIDTFCDGVLAHYSEMDEICEDLKDLICEYLYIKWGLEPRRPMILEYEDGSESYEEYPYSFMELENENNPIFMQ